MNKIDAVEKTLKLTEASIKNELAEYQDKPYKAIFEYIWNSFDAGATEIQLSYEIPDDGMGYIFKLEITDNGNGWDFNSNNTSDFLASDKAEDLNKNKSLPRGRLGRGRYVFIWFCERLTAVSNDQKATFQKNTQFQIEKIETQQIGTKLIFEEIGTVLNNALKNQEQFINELLKEFAWFLYEIDNRKIFINKVEIKPTDLVKEELLINNKDFPTDLRTDLNNTHLECKLVLWNQKPNEYAKFYFVNKEKKQEVFISTTKLNKKRDDFWHSVYIYSDLFDINDIQIENEIPQLDFKQNNHIKRKVLSELRTKLVKMRKPLLIDNSEKIIEDFRKNNILPELQKYGIFDSKSYEDLLKQIYVISPSVFIGKSKEDQIFMCSIFAGILSSADATLIQMILEQLNEMTDEDKNSLHQILQRTSLTNITRTIKEIDYRLAVLEQLKILLFINKNETLEVNHLQKILNENTWLFAENYRLFANTEGSLKNTLKKFATDILRKDPEEIKTNSRGELDLFLTKNLEESENIFKNLIIEIKRPAVTLGKKEYDQIVKYAADIMEEKICNGDHMYWEFILVGNNYNEHIKEQIENLKQAGENSKGLTQNTKEGRKKIYVRKWSDIINVEQGHKMKYLRDRLKIVSSQIEMVSSSEIVDSIINSKS